MGCRLLRMLMPVVAFIAVLLFAQGSLLAASYIDEMTDRDNNHIKTYHKIAPGLEGIQMNPAFPDSSVNMLMAGAMTGHAQYRIAGAQTVEVYIYSNPGTFAVEMPEKAGYYTLGLFTSNQQVTNAAHKIPAQFSPSGGKLYATIAGTLHRAVFEGYFYHFVPTDDAPAGLINYGLNIYTSRDGQRFTRVNTQLAAVTVHKDMNFTYERHVAQIPADAAWVRVEVNDFQSIEQAGGKPALYKAPGLLTGLASVRFDGDRLTLGAPEPLTPEPNVPPLPEKEEDEEKEKKIVLPPKIAPDAPASSKEPKFEGSIVISGGGSERATSGSSTRSRSSSKSMSESESESAASEDSTTASQREIPVYEVERKSEGTGMSGGVTVYAVTVAGAAAAVLLIKKK